MKKNGKKITAEIKESKLLAMQSMSSVHALNQYGNYTLTYEYCVVNAQKKHVEQ